ncbi:MAG: outer membrane protein assembly factor BamA [Desulfovibrionaceae bacterium]
MYKALHVNIKKSTVILLVFLFSLSLTNTLFAETTPSNTVFAIFPFDISVSRELEGIRANFPSLFATRISQQDFSIIPYKDVQEYLTNNAIESVNTTLIATLLPKLQANYGIYGSLIQDGPGFTLRVLLLSSKGLVKEFSSTHPSFIELNIALDTMVKNIQNELFKNNLIESITIVGNKFIEEAAILSRLPIAIGDIPTARNIDLAIKSLWNMGYFNDIKVSEKKDSKGISLIFHVVEKPRITTIQFSGNKEISTKKLRELLVSQVGEVAQDSKMTEDKDKMLAEYRKKGFYNASIEEKIVSQEDASQATLEINIKEGEKLYIKKIVINGLKTVKASALQKNFAMKKRTPISFITGTGIFQEEFLERDTTILLTEMLNLGYFDAKVFPPEVKIENQGLTIVFTVIEGARYKIGTISFKGDILESTKKLFALSELTILRDKKDFFNYSVMQQDAQRISQSYGVYGFAFADTIPITKVDRDNYTVDVTYTITRGEKVYIRSTILDGNNKTRDNVILRDLFLSDGDVYNSGYLELSKDRLARTGFFSKVETEILPTENPSEVDLKVKVVEQSTGSLNFGFGFSTYSKFGVSASLSERNLFGKGYTGSLSASFSSKQALYALSFTNPRIYDTKLGLGFDLYNISDEFPDFTKTSTGGRIRMSYPLGIYTTLYSGYRLEYYTIEDVDPFASNIIKRNIGSEWGSTVDMQIVRNTTNSYSFPSRGTINTIGFEYGGMYLGGDNNFFKIFGEHQFFVKILEPEYVVHFKAYAAALTENGTDRPIPAFERLYIGGINSVRGYTISDMSPHDSQGEAIGGIYVWYVNLEFVWLALPEFGLGIVPFYDIGMNYDPEFSKIFRKGDTIQQSVGLELRWQSPLGLLRLAYAFPLNKSTTGSRLDPRFEFSIGSFF